MKMSNAQNDRKVQPVKKRTLGLALNYVDKHFYTRYLFPIKPGAKFPPLIKDNLAQASNDPAQLRAWEAQWPGCNWGLVLRKSNLLIADIDTNPKKGKVGQATYDDLDLIYGWPETEMTTTPSGGFHMIYEGLPGLPIPMALGANGIGKDIDVPNYVLIPGCTFDDGTSYTTNDLVAVPCPQWIYDAIKMAKTKSRVTDAGEVVVEPDKQANIDLAIDFLKNDAEPSIAGQLGDANLLKTAYYLKDLGISQQLGASLLNEYFNPRCEPPWEMEDLVKKMAGAYSYANLSKVGGKTAEADFSDDPPEPITPTISAERIAKQKTARKEDREQGIVTKPPKYIRKRVFYNPTNLTQSLYDAMTAIRTDKVHDHIFRRGPELVRLNQAVTKRDLEGEKRTDVKRKRGALTIATVVRDYMTLRLDQAGMFFVSKKPKKAAKKETANVTI
jgi:hypothetical protein